MEQLHFQIMLTNNYYLNPNTIYLYCPMKIKKSSNKLSDIGTNLITAKKNFGHLIKKISTNRYGNDKQLIPTFSSYEIYEYSDSMLKHLPKNSIKK